jgi:hypothetical protein
MSIIDSLKRLERAGEEDSRSIKKLHRAAADVADWIIKAAPEGIRLPRNYIVVRRQSNTGSLRFLVLCDVEPDDIEVDAGDYPNLVSLYIDGMGGPLHGDPQCFIPPQTRQGSLTFAKDVAEGLLDEIAVFLEACRANQERAAQVLEGHLPPADPGPSIRVPLAEDPELDEVAARLNARDEHEPRGHSYDTT